MMARPVKKGLDYFPMDISFFNDIKIRKLIKYQGGKSIAIYTYLLCNIYQYGYYIKWDKELPFVISEVTGYEEGYILEVIKCCIKIGLFSEELFNSHSILTSKGIQERYTLICISAKRKYNISEFNLINSEETVINSEETNINSGFSTQSKVKESKVKEREIKKHTKKVDSQIPDPSSTSPKIDLSEKEKSSAKKEKELQPFKDVLLEYGAEEEDVNEWFKLRIENRKKTTRYFVEQFIMECKKNNFSVKESVYACAFNGWVNFNAQWLINQKKSNNGAAFNNNGALQGSKISGRANPITVEDVQRIAANPFKFS